MFVIFMVIGYSMSTSTSMRTVSVWVKYQFKYEYESKSECELKFKSNLENMLLAIDKNIVVACICVLHLLTLYYLGIRAKQHPCWHSHNYQLIQETVSAVTNCMLLH